MRITRFGHSCLLVEDGDARVLLDPGVFSHGFEQLRGLTAVLITHQHADHLDVDRLRALLEANPDARLHVDEGSGAQLDDLPHDVVRAGDALDVGTGVDVVGSRHRSSTRTCRSSPTSATWSRAASSPPVTR